MTSQLTTTPTSLMFSFVLVLFAVFISYREKLGLEKEILWAMFRMVVQLVVIGYVLTYIFQIDSKIVTAIIMAFMIFNAAFNAAKRADKIPNALKISLIAILGGVAVSILVLVFSGSIQFVPAQIIPITGMLVGNAMSVLGLSFRNLNNEFAKGQQEVNERLALGASIRLASADIIRESIKGSLQPTIDSARTVGLVLLPGMMTGMMLAGAVPLDSIMYQILIYFMMVATSAITSVIAVYLSYKHFYSDYGQLQLPQ
ncbi:iron export ABC transporter permease subunit FetB [Aerococcus agrisoli]|uniref:Iron export ABC transporter permease subunit FetB n=1 Tax=Aerococcus agrisoli TaxID=2487350 RepID=A0A3N4GDF8_9LACT|nr:iron export ABC transporter permease subunit FetB [Aerococcus agrisoli]RPA57031.1 iron export ABC transporter permease subunit FetB [Aerococcus agrisoli]